MLQKGGPAWLLDLPGLVEAEDVSFSLQADSSSPLSRSWLASSEFAADVPAAFVSAPRIRDMGATMPDGSDAALRDDKGIPWGAIARVAASVVPGRGRAHSPEDPNPRDAAIPADAAPPAACRDAGSARPPLLRRLTIRLDRHAGGERMKSRDTGVPHSVPFRRRP